MPHPGILAIAVLVAGSSTADASVPLAATSTGGTGSGFLAGIAARELADDSVPTDDCPPSCTQSCSDNNSQVLPTVISIPIIVVLVMMSGLFSGLTLGLMGLDIIGLEIVQKGENLELRNCAAKIAPLRKKGNQLLCTLLLGNVAVNSALSILTAEIADGLVGFLVSTALIVVFGEILPQAACSRYALQVGARTVPIVRFLMVSFSPLAWPISILLDWLLGQEVGTVHSRTELMEMLKLQIRLGATDEESGMVARQVAEGALCFRDKRVEDVMTPLNDAYMLSLETRLDYDTIREIFEHGFSRVPVFGKDKHDYKGLLYTKDLMLADPEDEMKLGDFISIFNRKVESFFKNTKLADVLNRFKKGGTHMGLVRETNMDSATDPVVEICGVLTLEDVMEEILQEEIVDETDVYVSVDKHNRVSDGRETNKPNLGVFNPVWRGRNTDDRLSREEIAAIAAHLSKSVFTEDSLLKLTMRAIEWLVSVSTVQNRERSTPLGLDTPSDSEDIIYHKGLEYDNCTLVLQGRISMRVGREGFQCEAGAFSILAKDALCPGKLYLTDFTAHLSTMRSRLLLISKERFLEAQLLDMTPAALDEAISNLAQQNAGESARRGGRAGTVRRMRDLGPPCDTNQYSVRTYETDSPRLPFERNIGSPRGPSSPRRPPLTEASTRTPTVETAETTVSSVSGSAPASLPFNNRSRGRKAGKGPKEEVGQKQTEAVISKKEEEKNLRESL